MRPPLNPLDPAGYCVTTGINTPIRVPLAVHVQPGMGQEVPLVLLAGASNEKLVTVIGTAQAGLEKRQIPPSMTDIALLNSFIFRFSFFSTTTPSAGNAGPPPPPPTK